MQFLKKVSLIEKLDEEEIIAEIVAGIFVGSDNPSDASSETRIPVNVHPLTSREPEFATKISECESSPSKSGLKRKFTDERISFPFVTVANCANESLTEKSNCLIVRDLLFVTV